MGILKESNHLRDLAGLHAVSSNNDMNESIVNRTYKPHVLVVGVLLFPYLIPPFAQTSFSAISSILSYSVPVGLALLYIAFVRDLRLPQLKNLPIAFFTLILVLTLLAIGLDLNRASGSDFIELLKPIAMLLTFSLGYSLLWNQQRIKSYIIRALVILLSLSALLAIIEIIPNNWTDEISQLYVRPRGSLQNKAIGPFRAPYFAGSVYLYLAFSFLGLYIATKKIHFFFLFTVGVLLAVLTQSRTVFLAIVISAPVWVILYLSYHRAIKPKRIKPGKILFAIIGVLGSLLFAAIIYLVLRDRLGYLISGVNAYILNLPAHITRDAGSVGIRMSQIRFVIENNPYIVVGAGIGKEYIGHLESFYALYYYRYGLAGIGIYSLLWIAGLRYSWRAMRYAQRVGDVYCAGFFLGFVGFIVVLPILSLSSVITDQPTLYGIFYTLLGVVFSYYFKVVQPHSNVR